MTGIRCGYGRWGTGAFVLVAALLISAPAFAAETVDAGSLVASSEGTGLTFTQPGSPNATLELAGTSPSGLEPELERVGEGLIRVRFQAPAGTPWTRADFGREPDERFLGFGERSDSAVRGAGTVEHRVTEGPYQPEEDPFISAFVPPPGYATRDDATYFPIPWLLSTRGYGVLTENDAQSRHRLGSPWSAEVEGRRLSLLVVAGPTPREVLERFSAHVGRQPDTRRTALGPWWQSGSGGVPDEEWLETLRSAGALGSVAQTYLHYLPCADQVGRRDAEKERTALFHEYGLDVTTYFNPMICTSHPRYDEAAANGWLTQTAAGTPYEYKYTGSTVFLVGQIDWTAPGAIDFYRSLTQEALEDGHVGWMEDFGEYTPDDAVQSDGQTGTAGHNAYVRDYHLGVWEATDRRPLLRFVRSGWTGSTKGSPIVWGGDPTTGWGFDGLESAVKNGLSMGSSGVSRWGSDIGGFFALSEKQTTPELLSRWIQMGFASGVMRTQGNGFELSEQYAGRRAQIIDPEVLPVWARYAKLRTRLLPEIERAERAYERTGMPIMRQLALLFPQDPVAVRQQDDYMFGDSLLVAPVMEPGQTERTVYLPKGRWVDLWRSADAGLKRLKRAKVYKGGREITVPAPLEELPMFVRLGSELELLPKGGPSWREAVKNAKGKRSLLGFGGRSIRVPKSTVKRTYAVQWTVRSEPDRLVLGRRGVPFSYEAGVLRARVESDGGKLKLNHRRGRK
jgi:sulfoquinovosidase